MVGQLTGEGKEGGWQKGRENRSIGEKGENWERKKKKSKTQSPKKKGTNLPV